MYDLDAFGHENPSPDTLQEHLLLRYYILSEIVFPIWFSVESMRGILYSARYWVTRVPAENHVFLCLFGLIELAIPHAHGPASLHSICSSLFNFVTSMQFCSSSKLIVQASQI